MQSVIQEVSNLLGEELDQARFPRTPNEFNGLDIEVEETGTTVGLLDDDGAVRVVVITTRGLPHYRGVHQPKVMEICPLCVRGAMSFSGINPAVIAAAVLEQIEWARE